MTRQEITKLIQKATGLPQEDIQIEQPEDKTHGDYSTNVALKLKKDPGEIAKKIKSDMFEKVEAVKPGFVNFFIAKDYLEKKVSQIEKEGDKFGQLKIGKGKKVNVEFISANPTGPLTLGNGRGGFCGDVLANVLNLAGYKAEREYYVNDQGEQVRKLGHSVIGDSEAVYKGKYINELRKKVKETDPEKAGEKAGQIILKDLIMPITKKMGVSFDIWFSEKSLYQKGEVKKVLEFLKKKKLSFEKEGALWFKSTKFGDDKDRVLIKADGETTYFLSDIAYLQNKFKRGFDKLIFFWGADHYGYIGRLKGVALALGYKKEKIDIVIMQLVKLTEKGKEVRMSKRAGIYVTLEELIDKVGLDVARFFFLQRASNSHLNFNLDLAKEQSEKNPVYYVQYAHARICSILRKTKGQKGKGDAKLLIHPSELSLAKQLIRLPEVVEDVSRDYQVQRVPQYAADLATAFHRFYKDCQVISEDKSLTQARLSLVLSAKIVLKNTLSLMGISAPEKM